MQHRTRPIRAGLGWPRPHSPYHIISYRPTRAAAMTCVRRFLAGRRGVHRASRGSHGRVEAYIYPVHVLISDSFFMLAASLFEHPTCAVIWLSCLQRCECLSQPRVCDAQGPKLDLGLHHFVISVIITILTFEPRSWADRTYPLSGSVFSLRTLEPFQTFQSPELSPSCQVGLSISLYGPISALSW